MALQEGFVKTLVDATRDWVKDYIDNVGSQELGNETVTINLTTEDSVSSTANLTVKVDVEGEISERELTTNSTGSTSFVVKRGLTYVIKLPSISGYCNQPKITLNAYLPVRTISVEYLKPTSEHVTVNLSYTGGNGTRANEIEVEIDNVSSTHTVTDNTAEFDVEIGKAYIIKCKEVDSYATPPRQVFTAGQESRTVNFSYIEATFSMTWIKTDGTSVKFEDVTADMKSELVGLRISTKTLIEKSASYIIPLQYLLGEKSIGNKAWCTTNAQFKSLPYVTSSATASNADHVNGDINTENVIYEALNGNDVGIAPSTSVPAFSAVRQVKYTISGQVYNGFIGSYYQMVVFADNRTDINTICTNVFGKSCINVSGGYWWTSTQCSATSAVLLLNGGWNFNSKTNSNSVVPLLAY